MEQHEALLGFVPSAAASLSACGSFSCSQGRRGFLNSHLEVARLFVPWAVVPCALWTQYLLAASFIAQVNFCFPWRRSHSNRVQRPFLQCSHSPA